MTFRDPETFEVQGSLDVTLDGSPLTLLNELECVGTSVYANVWMSDFIARIDSGTGKVNLLVDATGLLTVEEASGSDVLNGIAHDPSTGRYYLTGKLWPKLFEVEWADGGEGVGTDSGEVGNPDGGSEGAGEQGGETEGADHKGSAGEDPGCSCAFATKPTAKARSLAWLIMLGAIGLRPRSRNPLCVGTRQPRRRR